MDYKFHFLILKTLVLPGGEIYGVHFHFISSQLGKVKKVQMNMDTVPAPRSFIPGIMDLFVGNLKI